MLPNFLIIGAMKAGTTSLHHYLSRHPQVFMAKSKELDFFVEERNWRLGREWYERNFESAGTAVAVGESSPSYSLHPVFRDVPARIARVIPDARLIYLVRHPIDRIRSQYLATHYLSRNGRGWRGDPIRRERLPIEQAVRANPLYYVDSCRYAMQIEQYLEHFPVEQMLVVRTEDLRETRHAALRRICGFLGIDPAWNDPVLEDEFNRTHGQRSRRPITRAVSRLPGYARATAIVPRSIKLRSTNRLATQVVDVERARVTEAFQRELEDLVRDDAARLRQYLSDDFDGWGIV